MVGRPQAAGAVDGPGAHRVDQGLAARQIETARGHHHQGDKQKLGRGSSKTSWRTLRTFPGKTSTAKPWICCTFVPLSDACSAIGFSGRRRGCKLLRLQFLKNKECE
eukprot:scaffold61884_cov44-Prasinocladus_malaysianus.AAC.1